MTFSTDGATSCIQSDYLLMIYVTNPLTNQNIRCNFGKSRDVCHDNSASIFISHKDESEVTLFSQVCVQFFQFCSFP